MGRGTTDLLSTTTATDDDRLGPLVRLGVEHADLTRARLARRLETLLLGDRPRYDRLAAYCRNPMFVVGRAPGSTGERPYRQAQEWGLPARIVGDVTHDVRRKEVVVENDIGWRVEAQIDLMFGRAVELRCVNARVEAVLSRVFALHGGVGFLQQLALLAATHGFADVLVKLDPTAALDGDDDITRAARQVRFELVEAPRALPFALPTDAQRVALYGQVWTPCEEDAPDAPSSYWKRLLRREQPRKARALWPELPGRSVEVELLAPTRWQRWRDGRLVAEGRNALGRVPVVHLQNAARPFEYAGPSDVEPLIPLQDELNARLSDRANRVALQSMKMYLGRGIDNFLELPVAPGRMWATDNPDATVQEFGGDSGCPSERDHIRQVREALDKQSGVSPLAAGVVRGRIGRLTSAVALRVAMRATRARVERKRALVAAAVAELCGLALAWLDATGAFATAPEERAVELVFPARDDLLESS